MRLLPCLVLAGAGIACAADVDRGRLLYELRCGACHTESVHGRKVREAKDFDGVRGWVNRWNQTLLLGWNGDDVDNVAIYLNETYYRYKCPAEVCRMVSGYEEAEVASGLAGAGSCATSTRLRPADFARYMAWSASRTTRSH